MSTTFSQRDSAILSAWLTDRSPIPLLAQKLGLAPEALTEWAASERIQSILAKLAWLQEQRATFFAADALGPLAMSKETPPVETRRSFALLLRWLRPPRGAGSFVPTRAADDVKTRRAQKIPSNPLSSDDANARDEAPESRDPMPPRADVDAPSRLPAPQACAPIFTPTPPACIRNERIHNGRHLNASTLVAAAGAPVSTSDWLLPPTTLAPSFQGTAPPPFFSSSPPRSSATSAFPLPCSLAA